MLQKLKTDIFQPLKGVIRIKTRKGAVEVAQKSYKKILTKTYISIESFY